jgi:DNA-directed RNA polymerase subunit B
LGLETDEDVVKAVSDDPEIQKELLPSLIAANQIAITREDALDFIGGKVAVGQPKPIRIERALQLLDRYFLPHLGTVVLDEKKQQEIRLKKALMLGQIVKGLVELHLGRRKPDDKDHVANKRVRLVGDLMTQLFRTVFKQFLQELKSQLEKYYARGRIPHIQTIVRPDIITERVRQALATGNWVGGKTGVSQILDRTNYLSTLSYLRTCCVVAFENSASLRGPRPAPNSVGQALRCGDAGGAERGSRQELSPPCGGHHRRRRRRGGATAPQPRRGARP